MHRMLITHSHFFPPFFGRINIHTYVDGREQEEENFSVRLHEIGSGYLYSG